MKPSRYVRGVDKSQPAIVETLRSVGCGVLDLGGMGQGVPDLLIAKGDRLALCEIKTPKTYYGKRLSQAQQAFAARWPAPILVLRTPEEALAWALTQDAPPRPQETQETTHRVEGVGFSGATICGRCRAPRPCGCDEE